MTRAEKLDTKIEIVRERMKFSVCNETRMIVKLRLRAGYVTNIAFL